MSSHLNWSDIINQEKKKSYLQDTLNYVQQRREQNIQIYPPQDEIFNAFSYTPFDQVKIVMLGQDPYHGKNQAHGICFSVKPGIKIPPSLRNIYKELATDIEGFDIPTHGYLKNWATQGILMLNAVLTVEEGKANSHKKLGWETFTDVIIDKINQEKQGVIFLLWGQQAQKKCAHIDTNKHIILTAPHPSPLSAHRGFLGCKHFSQANTLLKKQGKTPIQWQI